MKYFKSHKITTVILIILSFYVYINYTRTVEISPKIDPNSSQYINDIYMSDGRIYNDYLNEKERKMYRYMIKNTRKYKVNAKVDLDEFKCKDYLECYGLVDTATQAIWLDHPELLNFASYFATYSIMDNEVNIKLKYAIPLPFMEKTGTERILRIIDNIKKETKNMSDKEKIIYVYDWIGENCTYDKTFTYTSKNQSSYNAFLRHNAVCAGFAKTCQIIFQNIGIKSHLVISSDHMWNIVEYKGKYYYFDSTVASCFHKTSEYYYDGLRQEKMNDYIVSTNWFKDMKIEEKSMFKI